ncbi:MAG: CPBP family intramembrane metalloprotease [Planctomycetes bacterium]|nr:CPBP family intramembrane metalloprotease [Planctomycetota bacterium]
MVDSMDLTDEKYLFVWFGWFGISLGGLGVWLYRSRWGWKAFEDAPEQRHRLSGADVIFVVMAYLFALLLLQSIQALLGGEEESEAEVSLDKAKLGLIAVQLVVAGVIIYMGRLRFAGGLGGFGLSLKRPGQMAGWAIIYFVIVSGLVLITLQVTLTICQAAGYEEVQKHETLQRLMENPPWQNTLLLVVIAVIGAPLMEELLFRGIIQTYLIRFFGWAFGPMKPPSLYDDDERWENPATSYRWLGIVLTGVLFATTHTDWQHQPALLVLAVCLGYIYERRKNLLIPILVHSMFNSISVLGVLMSESVNG